MQIPANLEPLVEQGLIEEVIRPLRSGKEAQVYLVLADGEERVAKVYKEAHNRSFKHRSDYTEGRTVRNTRDQRAMRRQSKYGKSRDEDAWRSAEADIIYRLRAADVTVPEPFAFVENVLIMELVRGADGEPAPRLADIHLSPAEAQHIFDQLLADTVKMLCAGVVHGDLGEYNVLMGANGPVIIDFPQAVDPAVNRNARRILLRDISNLDDFLARHSRKRHTKYGAEMWSLYEKQLLAPGTRLTGKVPKPVVNTGNSLLEEMEALEREARERREALGLPPPRPARAPIFRDPSPAPNEKSGKETSRRRRRRGKKGEDGTLAVSNTAKESSSSDSSRSGSGQGSASRGGRQDSSRPSQNRGSSGRNSSRGGSQGASRPNSDRGSSSRGGQQDSSRGGRGRQDSSRPNSDRGSSSRGGQQDSSRPSSNRGSARRRNSSHDSVRTDSVRNSDRERTGARRGGATDTSGPPKPRGIQERSTRPRNSDSAPPPVTHRRRRRRSED